MNIHSRKHISHIKTALRACLLLLGVGSLSSCDIETSGNGDLDGMWHLRTVDTLSTGGTCDMSTGSIYWSVQARLLVLEDKSDVYDDIVVRFEHSNDTLRLYSPQIFYRASYKEVDDVSQLKPYGLDSVDQSFSIERLDGSRMTLASDSLRMYFKKF